MRRVIPALLAIAVAACSSALRTSYTTHVGPPIKPVQVPVYIDVRFESQEQISIAEAVDEWNGALNGYRRFSIATNRFDMDPAVLSRVHMTGLGLVVLRNTSDDYVGAWVPREVLAWSTLNGWVIHVMADHMGERSLRRVMLHEMGHILGISHTETPGSLMRSEYRNAGQCIDRDTLVQLTTVHPYYSIGFLNWCEVTNQ